jgi:AcrR family transcriptional regulator
VADRSAIGAVRARRRAEREQHGGPVDRRQLILDATGRALATTPLHDLTIDQLVQESGVARATFYAYFESKYEVVGALLETAVIEMEQLLAAYVDRAPETPPEDAIRQALTDVAELWQRHAAVYRAFHDNRHAVPELAEQWVRGSRRFTDAITTRIERDRASGVAPVGPNPRVVAATLVWCTEHLFYLADAGIDPDIPAGDTTTEMLVQMWTRMLYPRGD